MLNDPEEHLRGLSPQPTWTPTPPSKKVFLHLTWIDATKRYKIITVNNTGYYKPDQWIMEDDIHKITAMENWEYTVDSPDYLGAILGVARKLVPLPLAAKFKSKPRKGARK
jgi:hypothetical protein